MGTGFEPLAIDHDLNLAYGRKKKGRPVGHLLRRARRVVGRESVYARSDVDVTGLFSVGRRNRVVGVGYEMFVIPFTSIPLSRR